MTPKPSFEKPSYIEPRLTRKEIADLFSVSVETVKRRTADHLLNPEAVNARVLHYSMNDLRAMVAQGYRLDVKKAAAFGVPLDDLGYHPTTPRSLAEVATNVDSATPTPIEPMPTSASVAAGQDFGAEVFRAQLRWALRQPDVRNMLIQVLTETHAHP